MIAHIQCQTLPFLDIYHAPYTPLWISSTFHHLILQESHGDHSLSRLLLTLTNQNHMFTLLYVVIRLISKKKIYV